MMDELQVRRGAAHKRSIQIERVSPDGEVIWFGSINLAAIGTRDAAATSIRKAIDSGEEYAGFHWRRAAAK